MMVMANAFPTAALLALLVLFYRFARSYVRWLTSPLNDLPGPPKTSFLFGYFLDISRAPFLAPHKRWWADAISRSSVKDVDMLQYTDLFGRPSVLLLNADIVKLVLTASSSQTPVRFPKKIPLLRNILGDGLVTLEGAAWSRHRRIIQPSFNTGFLKESLNASIPNKVETLISFWSKTAMDGHDIDVAEHLSALTLDIIGDVAFSHDFHALDVLQKKWTLKQNSVGISDSDDKLSSGSDSLSTSLLESLKPTVLTAVFAVLGYPRMDLWLNPKTRRSNKCLNEAVDQVIHNARSKAALSESSSTSSSHKSLLQLLFDAKDEGTNAENDERSNKALSNIELRDEAKTFLVAGHETTSTWCYWVFFALVKYPEVQQRVYDDIIQHAPGSETIDLEALNKMTYLAAFLKEVLRLYPPVGIIIRRTSRDENFMGHYIPANTRLVISPHLLHRHPLYWPDPLVFSPERWLPTGGIDNEEKRHRFCYLPFSAGGRNCVGQQFATMEVQLILAPILRAFELHIAPSLQNIEFTFTTFVTMKAKPEFKICLSPRVAI